MLDEVVHMQQNRSLGLQKIFFKMTNFLHSGKKGEKKPGGGGGREKELTNSLSRRLTMTQRKTMTNSLFGCLTFEYFAIPIVEEPQKALQYLFLASLVRQKQQLVDERRELL